MYEYHYYISAKQAAASTANKTYSERKGEEIERMRRMTEALICVSKQDRTVVCSTDAPLQGIVRG